MKNNDRGRGSDENGGKGGAHDLQQLVRDSVALILKRPIPLQLDGNQLFPVRLFRVGLKGVVQQQHRPLPGEGFWLVS